MSQTKPVITTSYDLLAFEEDDLADMQSALEAIGPTRMRAAYKERGGIDTTFWMTVTWIGLSAASGIVGHIATKHYEAILKAIREFYRKRSTGDSPYAQAVALQLSYDDIDIEVNLPGETRADFLDTVFKAALEHLQSEPLAGMKVSKLYIPFKFDQEEKKWRQTYVWSETEFEMRYWGYACHGYPVVDGIYDSLERNIVEVSYDDFD